MSSGQRLLLLCVIGQNVLMKTEKRPRMILPDLKQRIRVDKQVSLEKCDLLRSEFCFRKNNESDSTESLSLFFTNC